MDVGSTGTMNPVALAQRVAARRRRQVVVHCTAAGLLGAASVACAQDSAAAGAADELQEVVVTGSRIRGIAPVGSSVISIGREALADTTAVTAQDLINQIPQNIGSGVNESTNNNPFGTSNSTRGGAVNLRGLGPQATLVLFNGHRIATNGTSGTYLDPSSLPAIAMDRVEVVADGASAIYGADAVAGVVNLILRHKVEGIEASARYSAAAGGYHQAQVGVVGGLQWSRGSATLAYERATHTRLAGIDRTFFRSDNRNSGGSDFRATQCNPGTVQIGTTNYPIPASGVSAATLVAGGLSRCELTPYADILPQQSRDAFAGTLTHEITDWLGVYVEGQGVQRTFSSRFVTQGSSSLNTSFAVPNTNPYFIRPTGSTATTETIQYSFLPDFGPLMSYGFDETYNVAAGFNFSLPARWKVTLGGVLGRNRAQSTNSTIDTASLTAARTSTSTATALNPYGVGLNSAAVINSIMSGIFKPDGLNKLNSMELRGDGPLFAMPGGEARAAIGAEVVHTSFVGGTTRGTVAVPTFTQTSVSRTVKSGYAELYLPLVGAGNARAGLRSLSLSLAARLDNYDTFGSTTNPKYGVTWEPVQGVELHASYGTSFRAPNLNDTVLLKPGAAVSGNTRIDPLAGNVAVPVVLLNFGNPSLKPETAKTWSVGTTLKPQSLPDFSLGLNYFSVDYESQIASVLNDTTVLQRAGDYASLIRRFSPALTTAQILADAQVAALIAAGGGTLNLPATSAYIIDARPLNLGKTATRGVDFDLAWRHELGKGQLHATLAGAWLQKFDLQQTTTSAVVSQLNNLNYPLKLKARGSLGWKHDRFDSTLFLNYANAYNNPSSAVHPAVGSFTTMDLHLGHDLVKDRLTLGLDVTNLFNTDPPFVDVEGGYDAAQASALGRLVSVSLRAHF